MTDRLPGFSTLAVHAGAQPDPTTGARVTPIYQTTSFVFNDADHAASLFGLQAFGNIYTRIGNPTKAVLEERVAALEGGTAALAVASGHAAQVVVFQHVLRPGDEFIAARKLYGGSINQFTHAFKSFGWNVVWADPDDIESFERAVTPHTKAIFIEFDRQSRRLRHRYRGDLRGRPQGRRAADRRQHAGDALSDPPDRSRRRHRRALADEIPRRPRQLARRHHCRCRHLRLVEGQQISDAERTASGISRHQDPGDLRQFRLCDRLPRARLARSRSGALAVQCVPDSHRHRDAAAAHAKALRERQGDRGISLRPSRGGVR